MASKTVQLTWDPQEMFIASDRDGHQVRVNMGRGFGAADLLSASLIGCSAYDIV